MHGNCKRHQARCDKYKAISVQLYKIETFQNPYSYSDESTIENCPVENPRHPLYNPVIPEPHMNGNNEIRHWGGGEVKDTRRGINSIETLDWNNERIEELGVDCRRN